MSEWLDYVKHTLKKKLTYNQAIKDASLSYKTRNEKKPELPEGPNEEAPTKTKRKSNKKVVENITLKL